jgi:hypothetical protein
MLKADHEANLRDMEKMARLVADVQENERRNAHYAISLESVRNLEQIEKLSKSIRARMKRY